MEKQGTAIAQQIWKVQYVAMLSALNITGAKYLQQYLGRGFCLSQKGVSMLTKGYAKVHFGSIQWMYKGKEREEIVECASAELSSSALTFNKGNSNMLMNSTLKREKREGALSDPNLLVILSDHSTWEYMEPVLSNRYPVSSWPLKSMLDLWSPG
jgi:hypothetical protein